ncbi:single-stranded DNA-binding protein [Candidatus Babeliales bacterium]|nr:single-stranded DNA-binding protein [Candidatus Babeliales bacterium]
MASYNRVIIMGNLTRDPEHKQLTSGQSLCRLGLASNRQFKNKQTGTMVQEVCFVDIDVWGPQADSCNQYLSKGRSVLVEGRLKLDSWTDNDGQRRSKHFIVADRVTFLAAQQQSEEGDSTQNFGSQESAKPAAELKASEPKPAQAAKPVAPSAAPTGEVNLKDEKPFEDDLPF